jgi:Cu+-exporting ATPase
MMRVDPVCGMEVDPANQNVASSVFRDETYYFCSETCRQKFEAGPEQYAVNAA